jgi:ATP-binding cassette, subfamily B, bacterial PglK
MLESYKQLFALLNQRQRRDFYILQVLMMLTAFAELIGVTSIMPFMAVAATPELIETNPYLKMAHSLVGDPSTNTFLLYIGMIFVILIFASNGLLLISQFLMNRYSHRLGGEFSSSLYRYYLHRDVLFHSRSNSADLIQQIIRDTERLGTHFIAPALRLNGRFFSVALLSLLLLYVDFVVALSTVVCLGGVYWFVFYALRSRIYENGKHISIDNARRNKQLNESFEGIRDIKLYGSETRLVKQFQQDTSRVTKSLADNMILGQSPYYLVETLVLVGTLLIAMYFMSSKGGIQTVLPFLTLYVLAGFKLVPKVQQSYLAITQMRSALPVFRSTRDVLTKASATPYDNSLLVEAARPQVEVLLVDVGYRYPETTSDVLQAINLRIPIGSIVGLTGSSGGGKSTLVEILMCLLTPDSGYLSIDGIRLKPKDLKGWQRSVGYVPQSVYLTDSTIAENIAFGVAREDIDGDRVRRAAELTELSSFIDSLEDGYDTRVGERGMLLSGGQRQRLGIARALYRSISILILDEATSALDGFTQRKIFSNLVEAGSFTIVMVTHREETLEFADLCYELVGGKCLPRQML